MNVRLAPIVLWWTCTSRVSCHCHLRTSAIILVTNQEYAHLARGAKELDHHRHVTSSEFSRLQETTGMFRECVRH